MIINDWKMDFKDYRALSCSVPCDMYSVLFDHGLIDDPYYGVNENSCFELSRNDCVFYSDFSLSKDELAKDKISLALYGLDTICDIYFNGALLDSVMNMHRMYEYDVKKLAKKDNELRLEFKSPLKYFEDMEKLHHLYMDSGSTPGASHLRKAFYMSGWDWAPRLPNMGIFRRVELNSYNIDKIDDILILQEHRNDSVELDISAKTKHGASGLTLICEIDGQKAVLENGHAKITVSSPRLWWPNGYGEQNLYDAVFYLYNGDELIDTATKTIGLRTLELSRENDIYGQEFCFKVNGIKIFAMGANHVPIDSLPSRMTNERLEKLVKDCVFANFNCVRVWGGAFYPDDLFYELCDKYGLIVWQDFMVACANVWMRPDFENEFIKEAIYNVKRIRHHASLGLLCGNNEMEEAVCYWDCADGNDPDVRRDYLRLYEEILPKICAEHAPWISYTPSSPTSGGGFDDPKDCTRGDVHFWDVWNGGCGFDEYRKHKFRFCSEYGFESLPCIKTIDSFCPPEERNLLSYTMESHQKHWHGNVKLLNYLAEFYQLPKNLEATVYASQLNQANAIKYGVEHFRRCRGYTMGSIYWQLNDSWPVASWSSIDYYGRYKALHYFARRFYQSISLGLFRENGQITVNVSNEALGEFKGHIRSGFMKSDFTPIFETEASVAVMPLSSCDVKSIPDSALNGQRDVYFYTELYDSNNNLIARDVELSEKPKHFELSDPKIRIEAEDAEGGVYLTLTASALAKNVYVSFRDHDIVLSDNYFDLSSPAPYRIFASTKLSKAELLKEITLMSVYDIPLRD
ncbi:MAG: glycoside hydrolase family 2 protein [Clostridia bacterium]|nr:glycoside hydrolase family 2 protein [Clostridia bacterium]MBO5416063.1 glycoside hydrolase family 2 protein [Clostridia bacterium]